MLRGITYYPALCLYRIQSYISLVVESCAQSAAQTKMALSQLQQLILFLLLKQVVWTWVWALKRAVGLGDEGFGPSWGEARKRGIALPRSRTVRWSCPGHWGVCALNTPVVSYGNGIHEYKYVNPTVFLESCSNCKIL